MGQPREQQGHYKAETSERDGESECTTRVPLGASGPACVCGTDIPDQMPAAWARGAGSWARVRQLGPGRWQLGPGRWQLGPGRWQLGPGRWQLGPGR